MRFLRPALIGMFVGTLVDRRRYRRVWIVAQVTTPAQRIMPFVLIGASPAMRKW